MPVVSIFYCHSEQECIRMLAFVWFIQKATANLYPTSTCSSFEVNCIRLLT